MGYYLQSIFAVSSRDKHEFFFYYIPPHTEWRPRFEYAWIDQWLRSNFDKIAVAVGPDGVIIAPSPGHNEKFITGLLKTGSGGCFFSSYNKGSNYREIPEESILHTGFPFLIVCKHPILKRGGKSEGFVINLAGCADDKDLARVFDTLVSIVKTGDISLVQQLVLPKDVPELREEFESGWLSALKSLHLKPNVFGLGINFNYLLEDVARRVLERLRRRKDGRDQQ